MSPGDDLRRAELATAALQVFSRFGFKKTSMDEVARAVGLSRQGLYLHFSSKEELFRAAVDFLVDRSLAGAREALNGAGSLEDRLVEAFVAVNSVYVTYTVDATHLAELLATATELARDSMIRFDSELRKEIASVLKSPFGNRAEELADVLDLVSTGAKHRARTRDDYASSVRRAVRLLLAAAAT